MIRIGSSAVCGMVTCTALLIAVISTGTEKLSQSGSGWVQVINRSFDVKTAGLLDVDVPRGTIFVNTWNEHVVRVVVEREIESNQKKYALEALEENPTTIDHNGSEIRVKTLSHSGWGDTDLIRTSYRITVPLEFDLELDTGGGSVNVDSLGGNAVIHAAGGSIRVGNISGVGDLNTAGGTVEIRREGNSTSVSTSGSGIKFKNVHSGVLAETSGGSIAVELNINVSKDAGMDLKTAGGDITLFLPDGIPVTIDARIDATKDRHWIHSDFPAEIDYRNGKAMATLDLAGGGDTIRLRTREGDIFFKKLD